MITRATLLERQLGLHRPVPPKSAALKALVGGTVVSVAGCAVLLVALGTALGVRNVRTVYEAFYTPNVTVCVMTWWLMWRLWLAGWQVTEFRERMEDVFPRMRRGLGRAFNVAVRV